MFSISYLQKLSIIRYLTALIGHSWSSFRNGGIKGFVNSPTTLMLYLELEFCIGTCILMTTLDKDTK